jgi:cell division septation protein DedD
MPLRSSLVIGILVGTLLLGLSCSGPAPDPARETESRRYLVQLDRADDKTVANRTLGRALQWWKTHADAVEPRPRTDSSDSPVTVIWRAPLYRVRLGPFASRAAADSVLQQARSAFPNAFVHPERRAAPSE